MTHLEKDVHAAPNVILEVLIILKAIGDCVNTF